MQFRFQDNLEYQLRAIQSVTGLLKGQQKVSPEQFSVDSTQVCTNQIYLTPEQIGQNRDEVISRNSIREPALQENLDFCVQMETGTGKTYVYLRTIYELHRLYGLHKFVIVVPSVAIRSGVLKTLQMTRSHFRDLYGLTPTVVDYNPKKSTRVVDILNGFVRNAEVSILVMTTASFNSSKNLINTERDDTGNEQLLSLIAQTAPILIMDEPQEGMDAKQTKKYIERFNPLLKLRYSATHKVRSNVLYTLDPVEAYAQNLVKKIEVWSVFEVGTESNLTLAVQEVKPVRSSVTAKLTLSTRQKDGTFKNKDVRVKDRDVLSKLTDNPVYKGWIVEKVRINSVTKQGEVRFSNGRTFQEGQKLGVDTESIFRDQIKYAIQAHYEKKAKLVPLGIKPVCLFFIDRVNNYVLPEGLVRRLFVEEWQAYTSNHDLQTPALEEVHGGYFATNTKNEYTDSERSLRTNTEIYDLILRDKEKLLSLEEPLEFIFSHSALGVGWDNPNVFTICTLNETTSTDKKRQEIGRGLRICVNQQGERVYDDPNVPEGEEINVLTVVPNLSYENFASAYQQELLDETGKPASPRLRNKRQGPATLTLRRDLFDSETFQRLWRRINQKTRYGITLDEEELVTQATERLNEIVTVKPRLGLTVMRVRSLAGELDGHYVSENDAEVEIDYPPVDILQELTRKTSLGHATAVRILQGLETVARQKLVQNPLDYLSQAIEAIGECVQDLIVAQVGYTPTGETYDESIFPKEIQTYKTPVELKKSLYHPTILDSQVEKNFAADLDRSGKVRVLAKLPKGYVIETPIGTYNPDFAFVVESQPTASEDKPQQFYFVVETKGSTNLASLRPDERIKIECAAKHFEALGFVPLEKSKYVGPVKQTSDFNLEVRKDENLTQAELF